VVEVAGGSARLRWRNLAMQAHMNPPIVHQGHIYGGSDPDRLVCIDATDGTLKWQVSGWGKGGVVGLDGAFIAVDGKTGAVGCFALDPASAVELGRIAPLPAGKDFWTAPIVAEGRLLVRSTTTLACVDLR
jgi:outer membrane protein assembly factor BamB